MKERTRSLRERLGHNDVDVTKAVKRPVGMRRAGAAVMALIGILLGLLGCGDKAVGTVTSVEEMTLTLHGMRGSYVYRLETDGENARLCRYRERYRDEETVLEPDAGTSVALQTMVDLMNTCHILSWDGFHGEHPKHVQDGIMFRFSAVVNGGETVQADGSANYPEGYHEWVRTLDAMLAESKNTEKETNS